MLELESYPRPAPDLLCGPQGILRGRFACPFAGVPEVHSETDQELALAAQLFE